MAYYKKLDCKIQNLNKVGFIFGLVVKKVGALFCYSRHSGFSALTQTLWKSDYTRLLLEPLSSKKTFWDCYPSIW
jgi:hypothetical protein